MRRFLQLLQVYLPVLILTVIALGTYGLVKTMPSVRVDTVKATPVHIPDHLAQDFLFTRYAANGELKTQLAGQEMRHYPDTETTEMDAVRQKTWQTKVPSAAAVSGGVATMQFSWARANQMVNNSDQSDVHLKGRAVIAQKSLGDAAQSNEVSVMQSEFFRVQPKIDSIESPVATALTRGKDRLQGAQFEYNGLDHQGEIKGRVRATLSPQ